MQDQFTLARFWFGNHIVEWKQIPGGGELYGVFRKKIFEISVRLIGGNSPLIWLSLHNPSLTAAKYYISCFQKYSSQQDAEKG